MRKLFILFTMMILAVLTSCSDKDANPAKFIVGFAQNAYILENFAGATTTVRIVSSSPAEADLSVPFTLTGEGAEDLSVSANLFKFKAGDSSAEITISRKKVSKSKNATMTLTNANGVRLGLMDYIQVVLTGPNVYSFTNNHDKLAIRKSYEITMETATGARFNFPNTTVYDIAVDEASTAVEGIDFEFVNGKKAIFPAGKNTGQVSIQYLQKREGHDKIVLRMAKNESLISGNNPTLTINIAGPSDFSGTWKFAGVLNSTWLYDGLRLSDTLLVTGTPENDYFTFKGDNNSYQFTPHFSGKLKNYFTAAGTAINLGTRPEMLQEKGGTPPPKVDLTVLKMENVNLNISPTDKTIGNYRVGFFMRNNSTTNQEELIMTIYEYKPTDTTPGEWGSWADTYNLMVDAGDDPVMLSFPIRIAFTRKE